jgi:tetratricopeptide (TPR) repeat protein
MDRTIEKALGLQMNGFYTEALNIYQKAILKEPNNYLLCEYYGSALASTGRYQEAKKYLKKALGNSIEKPQVLNNLATVNRSLGLYDEALLNVKSALKFKPNYTDAWINRANLHGDLKQWQEAIKCYKNSIQLNDMDSGPYLHLAHAYLHNHEFDKALIFNQSSYKKFKLIDFLIGELICYRAMGDFDKALKFAEELKNKYDNELMWFEWVQTLWLAKDYERVDSESQIAIEKFGRYPAMAGLLDLERLSG